MKTELTRIVRMGGRFKLNDYNYQHPDLMAYQGMFISVECDPNNASEVNVYETEGKAICVATRIKKEPYHWVKTHLGVSFPKSVAPKIIEKAIESLATTQLKSATKEKSEVKIVDLPDFIIHKGSAGHSQSQCRTERILGAITRETNKRLQAYGVPQFINNPDFDKALQSMESALDQQLSKRWRLTGYDPAIAPCNASKFTLKEAKIEEAKQKRLKAQLERLEEKKQESKQRKESNNNKDWKPRAAQIYSAPSKTKH